MPKTRLNISLDHDLASFIKIYAQDDTNIILSDPDFCQALNDSLSRLRDNSAEWYTFQEVFGE